MSASAPAVSVLMTMFDAAKHLRAAVESILRQTFADFEFLIVDDGSRDESVAIAQSFRDPRIRLIRNVENKGQTACLNQGLAEARGQWIARQDADDLSRPRRLERQMAHLAKNEGIALLGCQAWIIDGGGRFAGMLNVPRGPASLEWAALFENPFIHTAAIFRREAVARLGGYDESFRICQDYDLWMRLASEHAGANLPDRLVMYRHTADSLQHGNRETVREESRRVRLRAWSRAFPARVMSAEDEAALGDRAHYARLLAEYRAAHPALAADRDLRRTAALHLAQVGRATRGVADLGRAFATDPALLLRLAAERIAGPFLVAG